MKDLFSVTQPNIGENRPNLTSYYETVNTTAASKVDHMGNMSQDGGYGTLRSDQGQPGYPTVISRQESHVINQVTNNNTPALVAQALSGMNHPPTSQSTKFEYFTSKYDSKPQIESGFDKTFKFM